MKKEDYILIVEDVMAVRRILSIMLTRAGYKIQEAENGQEALKHLQKSKPKLIMLDVMMPRMDGLSFLKEVKANGKKFDIPIIMCTSKGERKDVLEAINRGAKDYVVKPFNSDVVLEKVKNLYGPPPFVKKEDQPVYETSDSESNEQCVTFEDNKITISACKTMEELQAFQEVCEKMQTFENVDIDITGPEKVRLKLPHVIFTMLVKKNVEVCVKINPAIERTFADYKSKFTIEVNSGEDQSEEQESDQNDSEQSNSE